MPSQLGAAARKFLSVLVYSRLSFITFSNNMFRVFDCVGKKTVLMGANGYSKEDKLSFQILTTLKLCAKWLVIIWEPFGRFAHLSKGKALSCCLTVLYVITIIIIATVRILDILTIKGADELLPPYSLTCLLTLLFVIYLTYFIEIFRILPQHMHLWKDKVSICLHLDALDGILWVKTCILC